MTDFKRVGEEMKVVEPGWMAENNMAREKGWTPVGDLQRDNNPGTFWCKFVKNGSLVWATKEGWKRTDNQKWDEGRVYATLESAFVQPAVCLFEVGKKYTVFKVSEAMAMTTVMRMKVNEVSEDQNVVTFTPEGKRKKFVLKMRFTPYNSTALPFKNFEGGVFEGWDQPFTCDTDDKVPGRPGNVPGVTCKMMKGNACYNFGGNKAEVKEWVNDKQLNPLFDRSRVVAFDPENPEDEVVVFPELYRGGCAPVGRMLETQATEACKTWAEGLTKLFPKN